MPCLDCEKLFCFQMTAKYLLCITFNPYIRTTNVTTFVKEVFWLDTGLDCDEMSGLWPNHCKVFIFYYISFIRESKITTFGKEVFD